MGIWTLSIWKQDFYVSKYWTGQVFAWFKLVRIQKYPVFKWFWAKKNPDFEWCPKSEPLDNRTDVYYLKTGQVKVLYLVVSSNQASGYLDPNCVMTLLVPGIWLFFFSTNYRCKKMSYRVFGSFWSSSRMVNRVVSIRRDKRRDLSKILRRFKLLLDYPIFWTPKKMTNQ